MWEERSEPQQELNTPGPPELHLLANVASKLSVKQYYWDKRQIKITTVIDVTFIIFFAAVKKHRFLCCTSTYFLGRDVVHVTRAIRAPVQDLGSLGGRTFTPSLGIVFRFRTFFCCTLRTFPAIGTKTKYLWQTLKEFCSLTLCSRLQNHSPLFSQQQFF